ncbi:MFS transporter [Cellulomonas chengniuliangii]|uniref:MFS transporter n=1 Tax=Cellulomonas chengniuliangii TaxID=2968084 RepID=A0ABY5L0R6_9CELL|nr:MFS transporter [Cellulomonas chengniuliangii]MCC2307755.1 MFS transporter [Cellulomonas chengniuliangii]UUI75489.1 MFS transporter [Cellulomonas chengniuliangii]
MLSPYRKILSRPGALAFSSSGVIARLPMSMAGIGIVLMVEALYHSYGLAGRVSAVYVLAQAICSPQLARLVDRHGQARVMRPAITVSSLGLIGIVTAALSHAPTPWLYATAALTGATIGSFGALVRARWSNLLTAPRDVHTAYSLESALDELVFVVGPVVATILAANVSPAAGLLVAVIGMIGGGFWFLSQRATQPAPTVRHADAPRHRSVLRSGGVVVLAIVFVAVGAIFGATDVATVAFADEQGRPDLAGVVLAVFALGSMISGLLYGLRHWTMALWKRFVVGTVVIALGASLFVLVQSMTVLALVMFVVGFAISPTIINGNALVQHFVPRERLTEGLTWIGTALGVGVSVGASVAGMAIDARGSHGGFLVVLGAAVLAVLAAVGSLRVLRAGTVDVPAHEDLPDVEAEPGTATTELSGH